MSGILADAVHGGGHAAAVCSATPIGLSSTNSTITLVIAYVILAGAYIAGGRDQPEDRDAGLS